MSYDHKPSNEGKIGSERALMAYVDFMKRRRLE
jgi:hypothetical protein